jgi:hypothetical protein
LIVDKLIQSGKHVSPIASLKVVSDSLERERVKEVVDPNNKYTSQDLQMLHHYVNPTKLASPEPTKRPCPTPLSSSNVPNKKSRKSKAIVTATPPTNGKYYEVNEFLTLVEKTKYNSKERGNLITEILAKNYVPVQKTALSVLLRDVRNGKAVPTEWRVSGRPPIANKKAIDDIAKKLHLTSGGTFGKNKRSSGRWASTGLNTRTVRASWASSTKRGVATSCQSQ